MQSYKITIVLDGNMNDNKHIRLGDFITQLQRFSEIAGHAEEVVSGKSNRTIYYRITDLKHSSPAQVTIEACAKNPEYDIREATINEISNTMTKLKKGETIKGSERFCLVDSMKSFSDPIGNRLSHLTVVFDRDKIDLDKEFNARASLYVAPEESCESTARGMLDAINIHGRDGKFWLYPAIGPQKIECIFPDHLFEQAKMSLGKRVEIKGLFKFKVNAQYAHMAEIEELITFSPDDELPTFDDIFGIDRELTKGLSCEDYIETIRGKN
jgi:hypothetical protein